MRVVARITVLTTLGLSVLAGIGAYFLLERIANAIRNQKSETRSQKSEVVRRPSSVVPLVIVTVAVLLALLPVAESWSAPLDYLEPVGTREAVPQAYRWLAQQPRTVVLEYPMVSYKRGPESVAMANTYQYYSAYHWQNTVNGSTTIRPQAYSALVHETEDCFPCPRSLDALWALGVEYVVVHLDNLSGPQREEFLWRSTSPVAKVVDDFTLVQDFGSDRVYRLEPRAIGSPDTIPENASLLLGDPSTTRS